MATGGENCLIQLFFPFFSQYLTYEQTRFNMNLKAMCLALTHTVIDCDNAVSVCVSLKCIRGDKKEDSIADINSAVLHCRYTKHLEEQNIKEIAKKTNEKSIMVDQTTISQIVWKPMSAHKPTTKRSRLSSISAVSWLWSSPTAGTT